MGAVFETLTSHTNNRQDAIDDCHNYIKECQWEYGHGGYSGTFAEAQGAVIDSMVFTNHEEAYDYLIEKAQKWGPAIGVEVKNIDQQFYLFGAWCSE